jgi:UDP-glucose 4-epimerase
MKIFVTGGAGFIGSHLVDILIKKGHTITTYDNLSSGKKEYIEHHNNNKSFRFVKADLLDKDRVVEEIQNHEVIFHIAANPHVRLGETQTDLDLKYETIATYNVLEAMRTHDIKQIVFSSSSVVYGETTVPALPEAYGPLLPISLYGAGKLASEGLISAFCGTFDFQAWMFRFANVVGIHGTHGVIVDFINKLRKNPNSLEILGDGKQCKPYLHVTDCVNGILFGFEHAQEQMNLYNLGCDTNTTVTRIAELVVEEMNLENVSFTYTGGKRGWKGDVPRFQLDITKMKHLGWTPSYSSDEAVRQAIRELLDTNL